MKDERAIRARLLGGRSDLSYWIDQVGRYIGPSVGRLGYICRLKPDDSDSSILPIPSANEPDSHPTLVASHSLCVSLRSRLASPVMCGGGHLFRARNLVSATILAVRSMDGMQHIWR